MFFSGVHFAADIFSFISVSLSVSPDFIYAGVGSYSTTSGFSLRGFVILRDQPERVTLEIFDQHNRVFKCFRRDSGFED